MNGRPHRGRTRWPRWVYRPGEEPDYRFSFANERTFLAWIRTALALLAAGVALDVVELSIPATAQHVIELAFVMLAVVAAASAWVRWALAERAMRTARPMPSLGMGAALVLVMVLAMLVLVVAQMGR